MNRLYTISALLSAFFILVSFSANPPDGKTGAPGESLCSECHSSANPPLQGTIDVEGFPDAIVPLQTYPLTIVNRNTVGDAVRAGFQMTILTDINTKAGEMTNPSEDSEVAMAGGRQYFEHNPSVLYPDSNVVRWTVDWTAPDLPAGSVIKWYAAGNIANGNFQNTGDRIVTETGQGSIVLSSNEEISTFSPVIYPNPGADRIHIRLQDEPIPNGLVTLISLSGQVLATAPLHNGQVIVPDVPVGVYVIRIETRDRITHARWSKM